MGGETRGLGGVGGVWLRGGRSQERRKRKRERRGIWPLLVLVARGASYTDLSHLHWTDLAALMPICHQNKIKQNKLK